MATIQVNHLSFTYPGSFAPVFVDLSFTMDSAWRLGLVGRNGRGKTTLVRLLAGQLQGKGQILSGAQFDLFPFQVAEEGSARRVLREAVALFDRWEKEMAALLREGGELALQRWGEIEQEYSRLDGYQIDQLLDRECGKLGIPGEELHRPYLSFSPGERTRMMLAALFLRKNRFLLIDEPTNHLDMAGRALAGDYLKGKQGFLLISHDRDFLDRSVDHIMALQKNSLVIEQGNYSSYRKNKEQQDAWEKELNERLTKDIRRLGQSSREKAAWSDKIEAGKIGGHVFDRGAVGAQAAKMMKRSLAIQKRIDRQIEEKETLLKELEYTAPVRLSPLPHPARVLRRLEGLSFGYDERRLLIDSLSLTIEQGERIAIRGGNGSGKSTLLKLLAGLLSPTEGRLLGPQDIVLSYLPQEFGAAQGTPYEIAEREGLPLQRFLMMLRKFDFPREAFERDARLFSMGQQRKLLLAAAMTKAAHLYLWDEPLNYVDLESREQIEAMLRDTDATLVFVEHDRRFSEAVATRVIELDQLSLNPSP